MATDPRKANAQRLLREAVTRCGRDMEFQVNRAFEDMGCSCHPLREEHAQLVDECHRLEEELHSSELFKRRDAVWQEVNAIDRKEHPDLDSQARLASPFFRLWLFERLTGEETPDLSSPEKLATEYAEAWLGGWRPKGD